MGIKRADCHLGHSRRRIDCVEFWTPQPGRDRSMKAICAWCGANIVCAGETAPSGTQVSHGICAPCAENFEFQNGVSLQRFIDSLPVPVLLVDADCRTEATNKTAREQLGKSSEAVRGELLGTVFTCVNSGLPGGCGRTIHCSGCAIRRTVNRTLATGEPQVSPATLRLSDPDDPRAVALIITTVKTDGMVLLRLEGLAKNNRLA